MKRSLFWWSFHRVMDIDMKHPVITQIFLEVVGRGKGSEVTTNQPSGIESSQSVPREGSLYKI